MITFRFLLFMFFAQQGLSTSRVFNGVDQAKRELFAYFISLLLCPGPESLPGAHTLVTMLKQLV
ncbi:hypothetical protein D3C85_1724150 [compost metagenome]